MHCDVMLTPFHLQSQTANTEVFQLELTENCSSPLTKPLNSRIHKTTTDMAPKTILFDIIGTLVDHTHFLTSLTTRIGPALTSHGLSTPLFAYAWTEAAQREQAHLQSSGQSIPLAPILEGIFYRILHFAGISDPHTIASADDVKFIASEYAKCEAREGAAECIDILKKDGWDVWAFTDGEREDVLSYFRAGNIGIDNEHIITCSELGIRKPVMAAYEKVREHIGIKDEDQSWFAAAHSWDLSAASRSGFKTAYVKVLEGEEVENVFGKRDVVAEGFVGLAEGVVQEAKK
jgi:2-haloacid dehalogenase